MSEIAAARAGKWVIIGSALAAAGTADWLAGGSFHLAYSIPVAAAALLDGRRGTAIALALSIAGICLLPSRRIGPESVLSALALVFLAGVVDWLAARERKLRRHYQETAERLSSVYEKVQANFEGMKRAERLSAIGQLSAGLAHEIRNPLASISGAASILARSRDLSPKDARCLEIISSESQRLNGLLTNFLNFARPSPPHLQVVELHPVLDNVLELASHGVRGKAVHFEKKTGPDLQAAECDPEQLEQVLLNLMINAIEASPDGGTVTLSASSDNGNIVIGVADCGPGVAQPHIDRLFDPFFTTKEHGTGLGLPVAHQIVRQMGGSLQARVNAGQGMTFSVVLPAKARTHR